MIIVPSLLNSNIYDIQENVKIAKTVGDNYLHIDVMDGNFVPMQSFGGKIVTDLKKKTDLVLDVHLMINNPELHIEEYKDADIISIHQESTKQLYNCLNQIKKLGKKAGVAINPGTPVNTLTDVFNLIDQVLVMTVNPGFGGQAFLPETMDKIRELVALREEKGLSFEIEVDGGIDDQTIAQAKEAGATVFVAGTYVFKGDVNERVQTLRKQLD